MERDAAAAAARAAPGLAFDLITPERNGGKEEKSSDFIRVIIEADGFNSEESECECVNLRASEEGETEVPSDCSWRLTEVDGEGGGEGEAEEEEEWLSRISSTVR